jgi:hypothetical protein
MDKRMRAIIAGAAIVWGSAAHAAEPAVCVDAADIKSKSRLYFDGSILMVNLLGLQAQGEAEFRPKYPAPSSECVRERFDSAGFAVAAMQSPFEKGVLTLRNRFVAVSAAESREIIVVYDGMASAMAKKNDIFLVTETRAGKVSHYAMFRDEPTYAALKPLVVGILDGSAQPLATVRWPPGAKEPVIDAFDSKRLK